MATRVVHRRYPHEVYVGRPSIWGNPYSHLRGTLAAFKVATREEAVRKFEEYLDSNVQLLELLPTLRDRVLGCWCEDGQPCHARVLARRADALPEEPPRQTPGLFSRGGN